MDILLAIYQPSGNPNKMQKIGTPMPAPTQIMSIIAYKITTLFAFSSASFFMFLLVGCLFISRAKLLCVTRALRVCLGCRCNKNHQDSCTRFHSIFSYSICSRTCLSVVRLHFEVPSLSLLFLSRVLLQDNGELQPRRLADSVYL